MDVRYIQGLFILRWINLRTQRTALPFTLNLAEYSFFENVSYNEQRRPSTQSL